MGCMKQCGSFHITPEPRQTERPIFTARKRSLRRLCFYRCLSFCPQGGGVFLLGGCAWLLQGGGMCGWSWGGMRGWSGGCAWLLRGGMHGCSGGGHAWLLLGGACVVAPGGACMGYDEIRRYDQWAGGTHPTGMHSCPLLFWSQSMFPSRFGFDQCEYTMMANSHWAWMEFVPGLGIWKLACIICKSFTLYLNLYLY